MKTKLYTAITLLLLFFSNFKARAQANTSLSNLVSPTAVNQNFLPGNNNGRDLGSVNKSWRSVYIDSNFYLGDVRFMHNTGTQNTFVGNGAGNAITKGKNNAAFGYHALYTNKTNSSNSAFGSFALAKNTASDNSAFGYNALTANNTGINNTAAGSLALSKNTNGSNNTATGYQSLLSNTGGYYNTAFGASALQNNGNGADVSADEGTQNTAVGATSMQFNTRGYFNTAVGAGSLQGNSTGNFNTAIGMQSMINNTTGNNNTASGFLALSSNSSGNNNVAVGSNALYSNTTGDSNIAVGDHTLFNNLKGIGQIAIGTYASYNFNTQYSSDLYANIALGNRALFSATSGYNNVVVGNYAYGSNISGSQNTLIGAFTDANGSNYINSTALGIDATITADYQIRIGDIELLGPNSIGGKVGWTTLSDERVKKNIKENVPGLVFINKLKPITYTIDNDAISKIIQRPALKDKNGNEIKPFAEDVAAGKANAKIIYTGFAAQEVEKAAKSLNYDFSGVDAAKNDKDLYGLRYAEFVVPLVKAVQELSKMNDKKDSIINLQQSQINNLESRLSKIELLMNSSFINTNVSSASLQQNIPNPFTNITSIGYSIPVKFSSAKLLVTDKNGKTLKVFSITNNNGNIKVDASTLASGAYQYSLYVDGKIIDTKQMVLTK